MISQDFSRTDSDLTKKQVFPQLCKMGFSLWSVHTHKDLSIDLSAVHLLYNTYGFIPKNCQETSTAVNTFSKVAGYKLTHKN